jgi:hypothetical protein
VRTAARAPKIQVAVLVKSKTRQLARLTSTARWLELADTALQNPKSREQKK